jgi:succinate dehydrogenase / fumarate reductase flavoprotein subunit
MALDSKFQMVRFRTNGQIIKNHINLVNPANKRNLDVIVVGTGLAGGSASALAELGYNVKSFCFQDSPRRAHSIGTRWN